MAKKKNKVEINYGAIVAWMLIIAFLFLMGTAVINDVNEQTAKSKKCQSAGYDGYKDVSGFWENNRYKCYKKVYVDDVSYEYEYGGYVD